MLISERLTKAMNGRVGHELGASHQYLNIAAQFDGEALPELAGFLYRPSNEERMHAEKFVHYLVEAGGQVAIPAVSAPRADIDSAETAAKLSLEWELKVTKQISALMGLAIQDKDHIGQ